MNKLLNSIANYVDKCLQSRCTYYMKNVCGPSKKISSK